MASNYRAVQGQPSTQKLMYKDKMPITKKPPPISSTMPLSNTHRRLNDTTTQLYPTSEPTKKTGNISSSIKLDTKSSPTEVPHKLPATTQPIAIPARSTTDITQQSSEVEKPKTSTDIPTPATITPIKPKNEIIQQPNINQEHQKADVSSQSNADTFTKPTSTTEDSEKSKDILPSSITALRPNTDADQITKNKDSNKFKDISLLQPTTVEPNTTTEHITAIEDTRKPEDKPLPTLPLDSKSTAEQIIPTEDSKKTEESSHLSTLSLPSQMDTEKTVTTEVNKKPEDILSLPPQPLQSKTATGKVIIDEEEKSTEDTSSQSSPVATPTVNVTEQVITTDQKKKTEDISLPPLLPLESKTTPEQILPTVETNKPTDLPSLSEPTLDSTSTKEQIITAEKNKTQEVILPPSPAASESTTDVTQNIISTDQKTKSQDIPLTLVASTSTTQPVTTSEDKSKPEDISPSTTLPSQTKTDMAEPILTTDEKKKLEDTAAPSPLPSDSKTTPDQIIKTDESKKPEDISSSATVSPQTKTDVPEPIVITDEKKKLNDTAASSSLPSESNTKIDQIIKTDDSKKPEDISSSATVSPQTKTDLAESVITTDDKKKLEDTAASSPLPSDSKTTTDQIIKTDDSKKPEDISSSATVSPQTKTDVPKPIVVTDEKKKLNDTAASSSLPSESNTKTDQIIKTDENKKPEDISSSTTPLSQAKTDLAESVMTTDDKKKLDDTAASSSLPSESNTKTDQIIKTDENKKPEDISSSTTPLSQAKTDLAEPVMTTDDKKKLEDTAAPSSLPSDSKTTTDKIIKTDDSKKPEDISSSATVSPQTKTDLAEPIVITDDEKKLDDTVASSSLPSESKTTTNQIIKTDDRKKPEDISSSATLLPQTRIDVTEPIMAIDEKKKLDDTVASSSLPSESNTKIDHIIEIEENKRPEDTSSSATVPPSAKIDETNQTITTVEKTKLEDSTAGVQLPVEAKVTNERITTIEENKKPEDILASPTTESTANATEQISITDQQKKSEDTSFPPSLGGSKTMPEPNRTTEDGKKPEDVVPASLLTSETIPVATKEITTDEKHKPENVLTPIVQYIDSNTTTDHSITPEESKNEGVISQHSKTITEEMTKTDEYNQGGDKAALSTATPQSMNNIEVPVIRNEESKEPEGISPLPTPRNESETAIEQIITTVETKKSEEIVPALASPRESGITAEQTAPTEERKKSVDVSSAPLLLSESKTDTTEQIVTTDDKAKPKDTSTSSTMPIESTTTATQVIPPVESEKPEDMTSAPGLSVDSKTTTEQMITTEEKKKLDDASYPPSAAAQSKINAEEIKTTEENKTSENVSPQSLVSPQSKIDMEPPMRTEGQKAGDVSSLPTVPLQSNTSAEKIVKIDGDNKSSDASSSSARHDETNIGVIEPIKTSEDDKKLASISQLVPLPLKPKADITEETVRIDDISKPEEKSKVSNISLPTTTITTEQEASTSEHTKKPDDIKPSPVLPLELKNTTEQIITTISSEKPTELLPIHDVVVETMKERMPVNEISTAEDGSPSALVHIDSNDEAAKNFNKSEENKLPGDSQTATEVTQPITTAADSNKAEHTSIPPILPTQPTAENIQEISTREEIERQQSVPLFSVIPTLRRTKSRQESIETQENEAAKDTTPSSVLPSSIETKPISESIIIEEVTKEAAIPKLPTVQSPSTTEVMQESTPNEEAKRLKRKSQVLMTRFPSISSTEEDSTTTTDTEKLEGASDLVSKTEAAPNNNTNKEISKVRRKSQLLVTRFSSNSETELDLSTTEDLKNVENISQPSITPVPLKSQTTPDTIKTNVFQETEEIPLPSPTTELSNNAQLTELPTTIEEIKKDESTSSELVKLPTANIETTEPPSTTDEIKKSEGISQLIIKPDVSETDTIRESVTTEPIQTDKEKSKLPAIPFLTTTDGKDNSITSDRMKMLANMTGFVVKAISPLSDIIALSPGPEDMKKLESLPQFLFKPFMPEPKPVRKSITNDETKKGEGLSQVPVATVVSKTEITELPATDEEGKQVGKTLALPVTTPLSKIRITEVTTTTEKTNEPEVEPPFPIKSVVSEIEQMKKDDDKSWLPSIPFLTTTGGADTSLTPEKMKIMENLSQFLIKAVSPLSDMQVLSPRSEDRKKSEGSPQYFFKPLTPEKTINIPESITTENIKKVEDASPEVLKSQPPTTDITELLSATEDIKKVEDTSPELLKSQPSNNDTTELSSATEEIIKPKDLSQLIIKAMSPLRNITTLFSGPEDTKKFEHISSEPKTFSSDTIVQAVHDISPINDKNQDLDADHSIILSPDTIFKTNQIQTTIKDNEKDVNNKEPLEITVETTFERTNVIDTKKEDDIEETMRSLLDTIDQIMLDIAEVENIQKELEVIHSAIATLETTLPTSNGTASSLLEDNQQMTEQGVENDEKSKVIVVKPATDPPESKSEISSKTTESLREKSIVPEDVASTYLIADVQQIVKTDEANKDDSIKSITDVPSTSIYPTDQDTFEHVVDKSVTSDTANIDEATKSSVDPDTTNIIKMIEETRITKEVVKDENSSLSIIDQNTSEIQSIEPITTTPSDNIPFISVTEKVVKEVEVPSSPEQLGSTTLSTVPTSVSTNAVVKPSIVITPAEPVTDSDSSVVPKKSDKLKDSKPPSSTISKEKKKSTTTTKVNPSTSKHTTPTKSTSKTFATNVPTKTSKKSVPTTKPSKKMNESADTKQVRSSSASSISSTSEFVDPSQPSDTSDAEYFDALSDFNDLIKDGASESSLLPQDIAVTSPSSHTSTIETTIGNDVSDINKTSEDETYKKIKSRAGVITDRILSYVVNDLDLLLRNSSKISSIPPDASIPVETERVIDTFDNNKQSEVIFSSAPLSPQSKIDLPEQIITIDEIKTAEDRSSSPVSTVTTPTEETNRMEAGKTGEDISNMPNLPLATTNERTEESTKIEDKNKPEDLLPQTELSIKSKINTEEMTQQLPVTEEIQKQDNIPETSTISVPSFSEPTQGSPILETTTKLETVSELPVGSLPLTRNTSQETDNKEETINNIEASLPSQYIPSSIKIETAEDITAEEELEEAESASQLPFVLHRLNSDSSDKPIVQEWIMPVEVGRLSRGESLEHQISSTDEPRQFWGTERRALRTPLLVCNLGRKTENTEENATTDDSPKVTEENIPTPEHLVLDSSFKNIFEPTEKEKPIQEDETINTKVDDEHWISQMEEMKNRRNSFLRQIISPDQTKNNEKAEAFIYDIVVIEDEQSTDEQAAVDDSDTILSPLYDKTIPLYEKNLEDEHTNLPDSDTTPTNDGMKNWLNHLLHQFNSSDEANIDDTAGDTRTSECQVIHETNDIEEKAKIDEKPTSFINDTKENIVSNMKDNDKSEETIEADKDFKDWLNNLLEQIITDDNTKLNEASSILLSRNADTRDGTTLPPHVDHISTTSDATKVDDEINNSVHSDTEKLIKISQTTTKTEGTTRDGDSSPLINIPHVLESQSIQPVTATSDDISLLSKTEIVKEVDIPSPVEQLESTELSTSPTTSVHDVVPKPTIDITLSEPAVDSTPSSVSTMSLETPTLDIENLETTQQNLDIEKTRSSSASSNSTTGDHTDRNGLQETSDTEYFDASRDLNDLLDKTASKPSPLSQDTTNTSPLHMPDIQIKTIEVENTNLLDSSTTPTDDDMKNWLNHLLHQFTLSNETKIDDTTGHSGTSERQIVHETNDTVEKAKIDEKTTSFINDTTEKVVSNMKDNDKSEETIEADKDFKDWLDNLLEHIITDDDTKLNEATSILLSRNADTKNDTTLPSHVDHVSTTPDATKVDDEINNSVHSDTEKIIKVTRTTVTTEETTKDGDSNPLINVPNVLESQSTEPVTTASDNISLISKTEILKDVESPNPVEQLDSTEPNTLSKTSVQDVVPKPTIDITPSEPATYSTMPLETPTLDIEHLETTSQNLDIEKTRSSSTSSNSTTGDHTDPNELQETSDTEYFDASRGLNDLLDNTAAESSLLFQDTITTSPSRVADVNESIVDDEIYKTIDSQAKIMTDRILYDVINDLELIHNDPSILTTLLSIDSIPRENEWESDVLSDTALETEDTDEELLNSDIFLDDIKLYGEFLSYETLASGMYPDMTEPVESLVSSSLIVNEHDQPILRSDNISDIHQQQLSLSATSNDYLNQQQDMDSTSSEKPTAINEVTVLSFPIALAQDSTTKEQIITTDEIKEIEDESPSAPAHSQLNDEATEKSSKDEENKQPHDIKLLPLSSTQATAEVIQVPTSITDTNKRKHSVVQLILPTEPINDSTQETSIHEEIEKVLGIPLISIIPPTPRFDSEQESIEIEQMTTLESTTPALSNGPSSLESKTITESITTEPLIEEEDLSNVSVTDSTLITETTQQFATAQVIKEEENISLLSETTPQSEIQIAEPSPTTKEINKDEDLSQPTITTLKSQTQYCRTRKHS